ncbi:MAG: filamentous hemagglutinin N-terminal domain-containing protein, partial [Phycisphaeraceae bacterium]
MNIRTFNASWRLIAGSISLAALLGLSVTPAQAGPVGADVVAGQANINTNGNNTVIDVATQNAIINYQSFNIGASEYVRFNQLNATSAVLNRIDGAAPTSINGHLSANGIVYFVNPAGVTFGNGAVVDVAGIYA